MIRTWTLTAAAGLLLGSTASAQSLCGFDHKHQQKILQNSGYAQSVQQMKAQWNQWTQLSQNALIINTPNGPVYEIPVVIHVIHTGGAVGSSYNPSAAQLTGMIDYLNKSYEATWASYPNTGNGGTFIPLRFTLAKRDPNCNATTGIVRVDGSGVAEYAADGVELSTTDGADEVDVKALSRWPNTEYYNVWVVNKIDGQDGITGSGPFTAGYAYFPGAGPDIDGTVMLASQSAAGEITLPHEVGHAFGLYHTFEGDAGGGTCPSNGNCNTDGDEICDTEPHKRSVFNCPADPNPCTGTSFNFVQHNFMDYSSCQDRFTPGQRDRVIFNLLNERAGLISSLGGIAPDPGPATACVPTNGNPGNNAGPREIVFNDLNVSSGGYTGDGNAVYLNKTCLQRANVVAGTSYTLSVRTSGGAQKVRVYIDYNNDGDFTDAGELIYSHDGTTFTEVHSTSYAIPTTGINTCTPLRMRVVAVPVATAVIDPCGSLTGQAEDYSVMIRPAAAASTIALTSGTNPSCSGTPLTFTATPGSGVTSPVFTWFLNGTSTGITGTTYTSSAFNNGDVVSVKMKYTGACGADSSFSSGITVQRASTVAPTVSIAVTSGSNPGCASQPLTFTATATNEGGAPAYQWKVNGSNVAGTGAIFTSSTLNSGDVVSCVLTSSSACASPATATSNSITISFAGNLVANVSIAGPAGNTVCAGKTASFTATPTNGGTAPTYQWFVNSTAVNGATAGTFSSSTLGNNATVSCVMTSNSPCVINTVDTSNIITVTVLPLDTTSINMTITRGTNPGCVDSLLEFTATPVNLGSGAGITWLVNGTPTATGTVFSTTTLANGDVVQVRGIAAAAGCRTSDTALSASLTIVRGTPPAPPVISFISSNLVASTSPVQWYGPSGLIPGATNQVYHPTQPGLYHAVALNSGCPSLPSNELLVSLLNVGTLNMSHVVLFPNPTTGQLTLSWGSQTAHVRITVFNGVGQALLRDAVNGQSSKTLDLSALSNGVYFIRLEDQQGRTGVTPVTLRR